MRAARSHRYHMRGGLGTATEARQGDKLTQTKHKPTRKQNKTELHRSLKRKRASYSNEGISRCPYNNDPSNPPARMQPPLTFGGPSLGFLATVQSLGYARYKKSSFSAATGRRWNIDSNSCTAVVGKGCGRAHQRTPKVPRGWVIKGGGAPVVHRNKRRLCSRQPHLIYTLA